MKTNKNEIFYKQKWRKKKSLENPFQYIAYALLPSFDKQNIHKFTMTIVFYPSTMQLK